MKKWLKRIGIVIGIIVGAFVLLFVGLIVVESLFGEGNLIVPVEKKPIFSEDASGYPSMLTAQGTGFVNAEGEQIVLHGIMAPDPQKIDQEKHFNEEYYEKIFSLGANAIRIPVHPDRYHNDEYYLWRYLDKLVGWAGKHKLYAIIDWHYIGNIKTGVGKEMPSIKEKPMEYSVEFWKKTAAYFKDVPNVIFELYNEPSDIKAEDWNECAGELVKTVRETGAKQLLILGAPDYSYNLSWIDSTTIQDENMGFVAHVFPNRIGWEKDLNRFADRYPLIVTEWGYIDSDLSTKQFYLKGSREKFGEPFAAYLKEKKISWVGCWYDDGWEPQMFFPDSEELTLWGEFLTELLAQ